MNTSIYYDIANNILDNGQGLITFDKALELAIKIVQADALQNLAIAFRQDGEFQESMSQIANALK